MSIWTHVTGILRISDIKDPTVTPETFKEVLDGYIKENLPHGSEQPLHYSILDEEYGTFVSFSGDLRDFELPKVPLIINWWHDLVNKLVVRYGVLAIDCEDNLSPLILYQDGTDY